MSMKWMEGMSEYRERGRSVWGRRDNYKGRPAKESEMRKGLNVLKEVRDRRSTRLVVV